MSLLNLGGRERGTMKEIRLIALDMDGTLLASDHFTVPEENIAAIKKAHSAGIHVCICTGRMLEDASDFCRRLDLPCMLIACNGARAADGLYPEAEVFYRRSFEPSDAHAALDILTDSRLMINALEDGLVSTIRSKQREMYHLVKRGLVDAASGEAALRQAADRGVMKFFCVADDGDEEELVRVRDQLRSRMPHLYITSSADNNIELMPGGVSKGEALRKMAEYLRISRDQVMAMGDAPNDLSMLSYAVHSVAMGNAVDEVKRLCRYQTDTNDACGVAKMIDRVIADLEGA